MITDITNTTTLSNGVEMPWLGLGVFKAEQGDEVRQAVRDALDAGYRLIDTAAIYGNEEGVGVAVRESSVPRDEVFITTKLWNSEQGYDQALKAYDASLERLGMDHVDLYLIHWPVPGKYKESWRALEKLYEDKRVRAIGVSNFLVHHLEDLLGDAAVAPTVNQVEFHPRLRQQELLDYCRVQQIQLEAWSPIMKGKVVDIPQIQAIARKHGKSPVQVTLRWDLQHEVVTIPKSVNRERIIANAAVFDFELTTEEMAAIDALDRHERIGPDPDDFNF